MFDSARESIENQFQGLVFEVFCILDILKQVGFSNFFLLVIAFPQLYFGKCFLCLNILWVFLRLFLLLFFLLSCYCL